MLGYVHECRLAQWPPLQQCLCSLDHAAKAVGSARVDFQHRFPRDRGSKKAKQLWVEAIWTCVVPTEKGSRSIPLLLPFLDLRKMISLIKYNILYIQPTVQLLQGWFSSYLCPSNLCKRINTALDPHLLPGAHTELTQSHPIGTGIW